MIKEHNRINPKRMCFLDSVGKENFISSRLVRPRTTKLTFGSLRHTKNVKNATF